MNHKLKIMGLALFATFVMSAVAAASASAVVKHHFTSDSSSGVTHLTAEALSKQVFIATPTAEEEEVVCNEIDLSTETSKFEGEEVTEVTVEPTYNKEEQTCTAFSGESELVSRTQTTGCHYTFTGETTVDSTEEETATVHLTCPKESTGIMILVTFLDLECIDIEPEQTLHGVTYSEGGGGAEKTDLVIEAKVHGIKSETTGPCVQPEEPVTHENGTYTGKVTVKGYSDAEHKNQVNLGLKTTEE